MARTLLLSGAFLLAAALSAAADRGPSRLLPSGAGQWAVEGPDGLYTAETLYEHIDGAAEIYRAFSVGEVASRRYTNPAAADIVLDIFDMGSSAGAFGAYHFDVREGGDAGIGRESELVGSSLAFWKGRFFVSITPFDDVPATREAVLSLGRSVAGTIEEDGGPPPLVRLLPQEGLVRGQVHYFGDRKILGLFVPLGGNGETVLDPFAEGVLARYRFGGGVGLMSLLLLRYPSEEQARRGLNGLEKILSPPAPEGEGGREKSRGAKLLRRSGRLVVGVLEAASLEEATDLAGEVERAAERARAEGVP